MKINANKIKIYLYLIKKGDFYDRIKFKKKIQLFYDNQPK